MKKNVLSLSIAAMCGGLGFANRHSLLNGEYGLPLPAADPHRTPIEPTAPKVAHERALWNRRIADEVRTHALQTSEPNRPSPSYLF